MNPPIGTITGPKTIRTGVIEYRVFTASGWISMESREEELDGTDRFLNRVKQCAETAKRIGEL